MDVVKAVFKGNLQLEIPIFKKKKDNINNLAFHHKTLGKKKTKPKASKRKEIINVKIETNKI